MKVHCEFRVFVCMLFVAFFCRCTSYCLFSVTRHGCMTEAAALSS